MNKKIENNLVPRLRFPEFTNIEGWERKELGEISEIVRGGSPRPIQDYLTTKKDGLNWLKIADVPSDSKYITKTKERVIQKALSSTREVKNGDLILSNSMSFGRPYILKITTCIHDGWIAIRKISSVTFEDYLYYYISSEVSQRYFLSQAAGAAVKNLNAEIIKLLPTYFSKNKKEQKKIADCLSSLDDLISAENERLNALKEHKKGLMQQLFPVEGEKVPKLRFPEFKDNGEWEEKELIKLADKKVRWSFTGGPFGSNLKATDYTPNGIRIIQLQNIGEGRFIDKYKIFTSQDKADELLGCNIYSGDIILSKMGEPVGRACIIPENLKRAVMASDGIRFVVDEKHYDKYFIFTLINSEKIRETIDKRATGSTRKRIGLDELKQIPLLIPSSKDEQTKIGELIFSLDTQILSSETRIDSLNLHKKGLMQGLFPNIN
ncbi:restriction endonuclease subunit S [Pedobacter sp. ASV28]|uniref:restriction endonuclease subunit S n=1 Tax=Pedobacter sp. ASV28 TaxID=2795123 RepID=UPI0018ECBD78|nr:restriction endonuclease subunit S [Pedobacter sp. ASV28]